MLTSSQLGVLRTYFGPEGNFYLTILEDRTVDAATKILYLKRALEQPLHLYLASLDKLYSSDLVGQDKKSHMELIRSFKLINDLKFNHEVQFGIYGIKLAREHYFNMLGALDSHAFDKMLTRMIKHLKGQIAFHNNPNQISEQLRLRCRLEQDIAPDIEWRSRLELPRTQQIIPKQRCSTFCIDLMNVLANFFWAMSPMIYFHHRRDADEDFGYAEVDDFDYHQDEVLHLRMNHV